MNQFNRYMGNKLLPRSFAVFAAVLLASCAAKNPTQGPPPPVAVNVTPVQEGKAVYFDQYPATVTPLNQVDIRPQVVGYINGIFFKDGQHVNKGEKLYSIDQQQYEGAYQQAQANLNVAKANLAKAQQDADRYTELSKQDAIARQTLDHAIADLDAAKMQVEAAKANVTAVQTSLRYSTIYAPFSGTIGISQVKLGAAVSPGQTLLNTLSSDDPMAVDIAIDQVEIPRFAAYLQNNSVQRDSIFTLALPDGSIYTQPGQLYLLDRTVDPQTGTIKARLVFSNAKNMLKPGITANIRVKNNSGSNSLLVPYKAVVEQLGEYFVFVVNNDKALQRKVLLGNRINDKIIVRSGLNAGDIVVTEGVQKLRDSTAVQVGKPKVPAAK
ncbi:MAG TPA: efflux RND transporter periplasmic adaptor subunit [Puia sp.]|nr:efflux RND transporter periplasmic adaptor subunit [Puia sp.]